MGLDCFLFRCLPRKKNDRKKVVRLNTYIKEKIHPNLCCPKCGAQVTTVFRRMLLSIFLRGRCPSCNTRYYIPLNTRHLYVIASIAISHIIEMKLNLLSLVPKSMEYVALVFMTFITFWIFSWTIGGVIGLFCVPLTKKKY